MNQSKNVLLASMGNYGKPEVMLVEDQSVRDIERGMLAKHVECEPYYDRIYPYFLGPDIWATCDNLWNFCKGNLSYKIEDIDRQEVSSPQTMLKRGHDDCKGYSLFIGGCLDAMIRAGRLDANWCYRFASYNLFSPTPGHVFVVVDPYTEDEIWVDAVLSELDSRMPRPFYKRDRFPYAFTPIGKGRAAAVNGLGLYQISPPKRMQAVGMAAVGNAAGDQLQTQLIEYTAGVINAAQMVVQTNQINAIAQGILQTASKLIPGVSTALSLLQSGGLAILNNWGPDSAAARAWKDLTSLNPVGLFNDLFNGRTYQEQIYWLAAYYAFFVQGQNKTNQNQMTDADVWPAVKWFIDRTGVYMSGTQTLAALVKGPSAYIALHNVNAGITTDAMAVANACAVAQRYWSNATDPGSSQRFDQNLRGAWANTVGVFDGQIAAIANATGQSVEQVNNQVQSGQIVIPGITPGTSSVSSFFSNIDPVFIIAGAAVLAAAAYVLTD